MDERRALEAGAQLTLGDRIYTVRGEIGRGGASIVYDASYLDSLGNHKLVRIKECWPHAMRLTRYPDGRLVPDARDEAAFQAALARMTAAYQRNHELFIKEPLTNSVANSMNLYRANGTVYIVSVYLNARTFARDRGETLRDCVMTVLSAAGALRRIHDAGYLCLDLTPDNILSIAGTRELVQLFDFDSVVSVSDLERAQADGDVGAIRASFTRGFAPPEQRTGKLKRLGRHTDLYSLGAVLFDALFGRAPTAFDCDTDAKYDFALMPWPAHCFEDRLFAELTVFFHRTLASYWGDRYRDAGEAMDQLRRILSLADEKRPFVRSTPVQRPTVFFGREKELTALRQCLADNRRGVVSLYGMGGIGKSTLTRQLIAADRAGHDAVLWLYDRGDLPQAILDDAAVRINTVSRMREESASEYLERKLAALTRLSGTQRILLVIDNFDPDHLDAIRPLTRIGMTVLLISRDPLPEGLYPALRVGELDDGSLAELFAHYAHRDLRDGDGLTLFADIRDAVARHTLLTELIARQVAAGRMGLKQARDLAVQMGPASMGPQTVDYIRDREVLRDTVPGIIDRLVDADRFTGADRLCLRCLSLFDAPGIDASLFKRLLALDDLDLVNRLEAAGWVRCEGAMLYLHPVIGDYERGLPWAADQVRAADGMIKRLYEMLRPAGTGHDGSKQFPEDYSRLYAMLVAADQLLCHTGWTSEASQRLTFRLLMDAPVDRDAPVLDQMLALLRTPRYLDRDSVLRLYESAAYLRARLYDPAGAVKLLKGMKRYLLTHRSAYYLSAYHRAMAVILHNADEYGNLSRCLKHEDRAIAAARLTERPDGKKQLAACLLDKATTLLSADMDRPAARRLIEEAEALVRDHTEPTDYEAYQLACTAAMCCAMDGLTDRAEAWLKTADGIAFTASDSDLSVAEHLINEAAPIRIAMERYDLAAGAVRRAIDLCAKHDDAIRYRETAFDAYLFLGRIRAMAGDYTGAEAEFAEAEKRVGDSPYVYRLPLCPEEIRQKAAAQRQGASENGAREGGDP